MGDHQPNRDAHHTGRTARVPRVAVAGGFGIGMTFGVSQMPGPGSTLKGASFLLEMGGKGSNQAVAASRLGADVALWTAIGDDEFGRMGRALWDQAGIRSRDVKLTASPTMVGVILVEASGENRIAIADGALLDLGSDDLGGFRDDIDRADVCLVSLEIPEAAAHAVLHHARAVGTSTVLNPAPASDLPDATLALADYLTPNYSEACRLAETPEGQPASVCRRLRERYAGTIVMTLGADGVLIDDGRTTTALPSVPPTQVVDTTGAGDAFSAAFAVAIAEGLNVERAAMAGAEAGAHAVSVRGVIPALPDRRDIPVLTCDVNGGDLNVPHPTVIGGWTTPPARSPEGRERQY